MSTGEGQHDDYATAWDAVFDVILWDAWDSSKNWASKRQHEPVLRGHPQKLTKPKINATVIFDRDLKEPRTQDCLSFWSCTEQREETIGEHNCCPAWPLWCVIAAKIWIKLLSNCLFAIGQVQYRHCYANRGFERKNSWQQAIRLFVGYSLGARRMSVTNGRFYVNFRRPSVHCALCGQILCSVFPWQFSQPRPTPRTDALHLRFLTWFCCTLGFFYHQWLWKL